MTQVVGGWSGKLGRHYKSPKVNKFSAYEFRGAGKVGKYSGSIEKNTLKTILVPVESHMATMPEVNILFLLTRGGHRDECKKDVMRDLNKPGRYNAITGVRLCILSSNF